VPTLLLLYVCYYSYCLFMKWVDSMHPDAPLATARPPSIMADIVVLLSDSDDNEVDQVEVKELPAVGAAALAAVRAQAHAKWAQTARGADNQPGADATDGGGGAGVEKVEKRTSAEEEPQVKIPNEEYLVKRENAVMQRWRMVKGEEEARARGES